MKILIFHTYNQGYLSSFFHELSVKLTQEGHDVVSFSWKASISERIVDGVTVIIKKKKGYLFNYRNVYSIIKKETPDVIVSNFSYVNPALLFGKLFSIQKNIAWFHSLNEQTAATAANIFIKRHFLRLADIVVANSYLTRNELHSVFHVPESKIKTIPFWSHIHNLEDNRAKNDGQTTLLKIGCPGRLVEHKNQMIVLDALAHFNTSDYEFHIAGIGPNQKDLQEQSKQLGIAECLVFRGQLSADQMIAFYQDMDVIVLPSLAEAFGLVFIEAISLGTPVIVSSKFGALTFIKDLKSLESIIFEPLSKDSLIQKLKPYFDGNRLPSGFFTDIYQQNFNKDLIYDRLQKILLE